MQSLAKDVNDILEIIKLTVLLYENGYFQNIRTSITKEKVHNEATYWIPICSQQKEKFILYFSKVYG